MAVLASTILSRCQYDASALLLDMSPAPRTLPWVTSAAAAAAVPFQAFWPDANVYTQWLECNIPLAFPTALFSKAQINGPSQHLTDTRIICAVHCKERPAAVVAVPRPAPLQQLAGAEQQAVARAAPPPPAPAKRGSQDKGLDQHGEQADLLLPSLLAHGRKDCRIDRDATDMM